MQPTCSPITKQADPLSRLNGQCVVILDDPAQGSSRHATGRPSHQTAVWTTEGLACELASTINRWATGVMPAVAGSAQQARFQPHDRQHHAGRLEWKGMCRAVAPSTPMPGRSPKPTDTNGSLLRWVGFCHLLVDAKSPSNSSPHLGSNHPHRYPPQVLWSASIHSHHAPFPGDANVDDQIRRICQAGAPV